MTLAEFLLDRLADEEAYWRGASIPQVALDLMLAKLLVERRLVEMHTGHAPWCGWSQDSNLDHDGETCETLLYLATPYATWPGYREEWRV